MKKYILLITLLSISYLSQAQLGVWSTLSNLTWNNYYDETLGFDVQQPVFSDEIEALNGREITISGYVIPVDTDGDYIILSAFPYANCFFCGGAGPETVMEVELSEKKDLINKQVMIKGILKLNRNDFYQLIYRLENAELLSEG